MKKSFIITLLISVAIIFTMLSCEQPKNEVPVQEYSTPTIKGTLSLPAGSTVNAGDIYVKVIDSTGATAKVQKANSDKTFVVQGLNSDMSYSILFSSVEPEFTNRAISRDPDKSNGVGGWIHDVKPAIKGGNDIGSVKLKPLGTIRGKALIDGKDEHYDTTVYIPGTSYISMTNADGTFAIYNVPEGTYTLRYTHEGYMPIMSEGVILTCPEDAENPEITTRDVKLVSSSGTVEGVAQYDGLTSHSGITIKLESEDRTKADQASTSEDGSYVFNDVAPGVYRVIVSASGYVSMSSGYFTVESATLTSVPERTVLYRNVGSVKGAVKLSDSQTDSSGIVVSFVSNEDSFTAVTDKDGYFSRSLKPGSYTVTASYPGYTSQSLDVTVTENALTEINLPSLPLASGAVAGFVVLSGSEDFSGVVITLTNSTAMTESYTAVTATDGSFRFTGLNKGGTYLLTYSKDGYVSDNSKSVDVTVGSVANAGSVTLKSTFATVKGTIQLEGTSSYENVTILLKNDNNQYTSTTDQKGVYVINRVLPGTYTLLASKNGYVTSSPLDVLIEPSSEKSIDTKSLAVAIRSVTGSVTLELLSDFSGALVTATNLSDNTLVYSAITNSSGDYTLAGMKPGEYSVVISMNGYRSVTLPTINIVSSSTTNLSVTNMLVNRGTVSGTVTLEGRSSSRGIKVELLRGSEVYAESTTDESGSYSFYVPQGNYSGVRYSKTDFASVSVSKNIALFADNYVSMGDTVLQATHNTVNGRVDVLTTDNEGDVTISFDGVASIPAVTTSASGEFSFDHIPVGSYVMRFRRPDCSDITVPVEVTAADLIDLGIVTITPNTATIKGTVILKDALSSSGVTVSVDIGEGKVLSAVTDNSGRYEIGGVSIADEYSVTYSKNGWNSKTQIISPKLELLEIREMPEMTLVDTTSPVLKSVTINNGSNTAADRNVKLHIDAEDNGSGISNMLVYDYYNPQYFGDFSSLADWTFESSNGLKTVYVKVIDRAENESNVVSAQVTLTDQKKEVKGVLKGEDLTWTKEMSPYLVTGNLLVEKDDTLTIEPGVDVQFSGDYYLQVEGKLSAIGTESERISIYGIDGGINNWYGMKFINNNDSVLSYVEISGLKNGITGYCDIDHALITANGWAIGIKNDYDPDFCLRGYLTNSTVDGSVSIAYDDVKGNTIDANTVYLYKIPFVGDNTISGDTTIESSDVDGNTFSGSKLDTLYSFVYNNVVSSTTVNSYSDIQKYVTYNGSAISSSSIMPSDLYNIQFNNCSFPRFAADVKESNFINCGPITVESDRSTQEKYVCTGNYWGDINTVEIKSKGEGQNLSFITDYYDDFNKSRIDYSRYKESAIENAGYQGDGFGRSGGNEVYRIGDTGPAGGYVFYDKGYYSDGWRYLEAAPSDIGRYAFGYYRPDGTNNNMVGTAQAIGSGRYNTERLVVHMDIEGKAYSDSSGTTTAEYAAKKCLDYRYGEYDDWFLPSRDELCEMYKALKCSGGINHGEYCPDRTHPATSTEETRNSFADESYCSSSENYSIYSWLQYFAKGNQINTNPRNYANYVRAVRAF